jgi:ATP-binding cassette, subfamily C (CFTR/MRP), member 1
MNDDRKNAMTLMSTDVEQICFTLKNMHEIWASSVELCLAIYLLERQLKIACIVPLIIVLGRDLSIYIHQAFEIVINSNQAILSASWAGSYALSGPMTRTQKSWMQATGTRLESTNSMISHMAEVKLSGLTRVFSSIIQNLRKAEISVAQQCRLLITWTVTICK